MKRLKLLSSTRMLLTSSARQGSVSVLFATSFVALLMMVGLAVDYSFYNEAQTQLNVAADAAAIHAVRVAVQAVQQQQSNYIAQGEAAGLQWFEAQAGNVPQAKVVNTPSVTVSFNTSNNLLTAQVNYTGVIATHFGGIFSNSWQNWPNWGIAGGATAVESTQTYIEIDLLLDNSSSMLIAANASGIASLDDLTPCSTQAASANQGMDGTYTWVYNTSTAYGGPNNNSSTVAYCSYPTAYVPYGYGTFTYTAKVNSSGACPSPGSNSYSTVTMYANELAPPTTPVEGACDSGFTGPTSGSGNQCPYVPPIMSTKVTATTVGSYAQCVNSSGKLSGGGSGSYFSTSPTYSKSGSAPTSTSSSNTPQAPCAFACHWTSSLTSGTNYSNDYYGLARQNGIQLRFDVVQSAAESVVNSLISYLPTSPVPAPFGIGVYTFNTALGTIYAPTSTATTASAESTELNDALSAIQNYSTPVVSDSADTNWPAAMTSLASTLSGAGNGSTASAPRKNLFIVTDGLEDYITSSGSRVQGPIDTSYCTTIKNMGIMIYVLYTVYYPLPNYYYLNNDKSSAEPTDTSAIATALQSCASSPATYFEASDSSSISAAMQTMLKIALTSPTRLSQ